MTENVPQHVISRVFQGRHLLRPGRKLNNIIAGVMAKAALLYSQVAVYSYVFVSNRISIDIFTILAAFLSLVASRLTNSPSCLHFCLQLHQI